MISGGCGAGNCANAAAKTMSAAAQEIVRPLRAAICLGGLENHERRCARHCRGMKTVPAAAAF